MVDHQAVWNLTAPKNPQIQAYLTYEQCDFLLYYENKMEKMVSLGILITDRSWMAG
jgi:hypothetical protein